MDCTVHGVAKSRTRLSDFHFQLVSANLILLFYLSPPCRSPPNCKFVFYVCEPISVLYVCLFVLFFILHLQ